MRIFTVWVIIWSLSGCGSSGSKESALGRARGELNLRHYSEAAGILEAEYTASPDPETAVLLAQAHLGMAGFEFLDWVGSLPALSSDQLMIDMDALLEHVPLARGRDFERAYSLLNGTFPDAPSSPERINFLLSLMDFSSAVAGLDAHPWAVRPPLESLQGVIRDVDAGIARLRDSYRRASEILIRFSQLQTLVVMPSAFQNWKATRAWPAPEWVMLLSRLARRDLGTEFAARVIEALDRINQLREDRTSASPLPGTGPIQGPEVPAAKAGPAPLNRIPSGIHRAQGDRAPR